MKANEAAEIIESMIASIEANPDQFNIEVNVTGLSVTANSCATGLIVSAVGGEQGSTTTGMEISISSSQVDLAQKRGTEVMNQQIQTLVDSLSELANELRAKETGKAKVSKILRSLKDTWVPQIIIAVLSNILAKSIGI